MLAFGFSLVPYSVLKKYTFIPRVLSVCIMKRYSVLCRKKKCLFCMSWDNCVFYPLIYYVLLHWFIFLCGATPACLRLISFVRMHNPFSILLDSGFYYLVENYSIYVHKGYWFVYSFHGVFIRTCYHVNTGLIQCVKKCSTLLYFFQESDKYWCYF